MIRRVLMYHTVITVVFCAVVFVTTDLKQAFSVIVGSTLMAANMAGLIWAWRHIFLKKSIALAASVIVFKYAILGVTVYLVVTRELVEAIGFVVGLSTVAPTVGWLALESKKVLNSELRSVEE